MPLDPQTSEFLDAFNADPPPKWSDISIDEARQIFNSWQEYCGQPPEVAKVEDLTVSDIGRLRIYTPAGPGAGPLPAVLYFHGGGWVLGNLETHDVICRQLANESGCKVIAVDYQLAPEHPFPAGATDCYNATAWTFHHAADLGIDPEKILVAGDSAGGNLSMAVCLQSVDTHDFNIFAQLMFYPVIDPSMNTPSYQEMAEGFGLTSETMNWFWHQYIRDEDDHKHPWMNPLLSTHLDQIPRSHIILAEYDVLRDEGHLLAEKLKEHGVEVTVSQYSGVIHGFVHFHGLFSKGLEAIREGARFLKEVTA